MQFADSAEFDKACFLLISLGIIKYLSIFPIFKSNVWVLAFSEVESMNLLVLQ